MKSSLQRRFVWALSVATILGLGASVYIFSTFRAYEAQTSRILSGKQKDIILGQLLEARVQAAEEMTNSAVVDSRTDEEFKKRVRALVDEIDALAKEQSDPSLDQAREVLKRVVDSPFTGLDQAFIEYRNIKTEIFNLYRTAWNNKWMNVARIAGLALADLENAPHRNGEKAANAVHAKIVQLVDLIARSDMDQASKLALFGDLNVIKGHILSYFEALQRFEASLKSRISEIRTAAASMRKYNEFQAKKLSQFGSAGQFAVFKAVLALVLLVTLALSWLLFAVVRHWLHIRVIARHVTSQITGWVGTGGGALAHGFLQPKNPDAELIGMYQAIDETMRRVNTIRKEEGLIKKLIAVPCVLINQNGQAVFWNEAFTGLSRGRSVDEAGTVSYGTILRFTDAKGNKADPLQKAFSSGEQVRQSLILKVEELLVPVEVLCTSYQAADEPTTQYVLVHLYDLTGQTQKNEAEIDLQLQHVRDALEAVREGRIPEPAKDIDDLKKPVLAALELLKEFALDLHEKAIVVTGQAETMGSRMAREAGLKKAVHGRMEQIRGEISSLRSEFTELRSCAETVMFQVQDLADRTVVLRNEYAEIKKRGTALLENLKANEKVIHNCIERLTGAETALVRVKDSERRVGAALAKCHMLNVNNSIIGARRELRPADIVTVAENVEELTREFEQGYAVIEESAVGIERSLGEMTRQLRGDLERSLKIIENDYAVIKSIQHSERLIEAGAEDGSEISTLLTKMRDATGKASAQLTSLERKLQHLVQIGQASIDLQSQLEIGFKGIVGQVDSFSRMSKDH